MMVEVPVAEIYLQDGESGYEAIENYIYRYWKYSDTPHEYVICSIGVSYNGKDYYVDNEIAECEDVGIGFLNDWWEGQKYIKLFGIQSVYTMNITGGVYED